MMLSTKLKTTAAVVIGLMLASPIDAALPLQPVAQSKPQYTLFAGSKKGTYYRFSEDIQKACPEFNVDIIPSYGSLDNINQLVQPSLLRTGYRFAFAQIDATEAIMKDRSMATTLQLVAPLYKEDVYLIVNKDSKINSVSDLDGKRISIGAPGSGVWFTSRTIAKQININWLPLERAPEDSIIAVLSGAIDGAVIIGGTPIPMLVELGSFVQRYVDLLPLDNSKLNKTYPTAIVPANTYVWQSSPATVRTVNSMLIASGDVPKTAVDMLTSCLIRNKVELRRWGHPKWREVSFLK